MPPSPASTPATSTPMLRSQTSSVLVPTWITGAVAPAPHATSSSSPSSSSSASPGGGGAAPSSGSRGRQAMFGNWRQSAPAVSPGTSPSLGASAPPPPPPSYESTVSSATPGSSGGASSGSAGGGSAAGGGGGSGSSSSPSAAGTTSVLSKKATVFSEIADCIYNRLNALEQTPDEAEAGKFLHLVRVAGLGEDGKEKVSSAVTIACQTQLSEPSGRFFVFELPPVNYELWPQLPQAQQGGGGGGSDDSSSKHHHHHSSNKKSGGGGGGGGDQQQQPPDMDLPPSCDVMQSSRVVCIVCPNSPLAQRMQAKMEGVFCGSTGSTSTSSSQNQKSVVKIDSVQRTLPISCCLVVKASNSANKNHEAETVPWADLMSAGAVPPSYAQQAVLSAPAPRSVSPPPAEATSKPPSYEQTVASSSASASASTTTPPTVSPVLKSAASAIPAAERVAAPFVPSYFRLLRNERGVFRNALFLRFASQVKAEISMMYLERLCLCGRRIRIEHKKQSRSFASLAAAAAATGSSNAGEQQQTPAAAAAAAAGESSASATTAAPTNTEIMELNVAELVRRYDRDGFSYPKRLLSKEDQRYLTELAAAHELHLDVTTNQVTVTRPKKTGRPSAISPALTAQTPPWAPQTPPLAPAAAQAASGQQQQQQQQSSSSSSAASPAPAPLNNGSFSANAASGTMTFRGLRHWKEQRQEQQQKDAEKLAAEGADNNNSSSKGAGAANNGKDDGVPPPMSLDGGAAHQKYVRTLDPEAAQRKGIAAFGAGRGRPVVPDSSS